jgi:hypothetical protein
VKENEEYLSHNIFCKNKCNKQNRIQIEYKNTVGKETERDCVIIRPDADQVNTSIWPGVSRRI